MAVTSVDLDLALIERARELSGAKSNRAVIDLALRRLIASQQKGTMVDGIAALDGASLSFDAPVQSYDVATPPST